MIFETDKAYLIRPGGTCEEIKPENQTDFSIEELYRHLDCDMVQVISPMLGVLMILDEESKCKDGPHYVNEIATALTRDVLASDDLIVGRAVLCPESMFV